MEPGQRPQRIARRVWWTALAVLLASAGMLLASGWDRRSPLLDPFCGSGTIAIEAALTGHLLLSTLHTNDAPSTIARFSEMGVEVFNISASLVCVCAQRLLRRVCKSCKMPHEPVGREKEIIEKALGWSGPIFKANPQGCPTCNGSGYKGRVGIHELMVNSEELTEGINKKVETAHLKRIAMKGGMKTLHQDSMLKVKMGLTTVEEALSNVPPDLIL